MLFRIEIAGLNGRVSGSLLSHDLLNRQDIQKRWMALDKIYSHHFIINLFAILKYPDEKLHHYRYDFAQPLTRRRPL